MDRLFPVWLTETATFIDVVSMVLINGACLAFYVFISCLVASLVF